MAWAVTPALPLPVRNETIASIKIGETREFWVSLPDRYNESGEKYPVLLYAGRRVQLQLGGDRRLAPCGPAGRDAGIHRRGHQKHRSRKDCFPEELTYNDGSKAGGRADRFLDFIGEELIPHIDKNYRSEKLRVLYGTSNTSFTAVYALFRNPGLADYYIAASATLRVPYFLAQRDQLLRDFKGGERKLSLVMGENDFPTILSQNGEVKEKCDVIAPKGLTCRFTVVENAGHVPDEALLLGLRRLFAGWKPPSR